MTLEQIDSDIYIASQLAFKASTADRRLAGAEWLQQLATELVELIKTEQFKQLADAFDEQDSPGDGWRWLGINEKLESGDEFKKGNEWLPVVDCLGFSAHIPLFFRRRI